MMKPATTIAIAAIRQGATIVQTHDGLAAPVSLASGLRCLCQTRSGRRVADHLQDVREGRV